MRVTAGRTVAALVCATGVFATAGLVALGGTEHGTGSQARAQGSAPEPPGPFPDVYAPGDTYTVPGERDGTSTFPVVRYRQLQPKQPGVMDFQHYHSEAEMNWWMRKWAYDHPNIVDLKQVGTSFGGKPIYQLTITNKALRRRDRQAGGVLRRRPPLGRDHRLRGLAVPGLEADHGLRHRPRRSRAWSTTRRSTSGRTRTRTAATCTARRRRPTAARSGRPTTTATACSTTPRPPTSTATATSRRLRRNVGAGNGDYIVDGRDPTGRTMRRVPAGEGNYTLQSESPGATASAASTCTATTRTTGGRCRARTPRAAAGRRPARASTRCRSRRSAPRTAS